MQLERIITLANAPTRLRFVAMERSLRATGCDLPLRVIPYDDRLFDLPKNASWWSDPAMKAWLDEEKCHPLMRKYQCLTIGNYQFVDSDVVFLRNPESILAPLEGFITSCGHWRLPGHTITPESLEILKEKSTLWEKWVFNSGQFACDRPLFTLDQLQRLCREPRHERTCLRLDYEQPGFVLLANLSGVPISNLTLPPFNMESTWAARYPKEGFEKYWADESRKPYVIHWAGCYVSRHLAIDRLFTQWLTADEKREWQELVETRTRKENAERRSLWGRLCRAARALGSVLSAFRDS